MPNQDRFPKIGNRKRTVLTDTNQLYIRKPGKFQYMRNLYKTNYLFSYCLLFFTLFEGAAQVRKDTLAATVYGNPTIGRMETRNLYPRKGNFFFYWGYNRAAYSNSDIHLRGDGYDFTVTDLRARDEPYLDDPHANFKEYVSPGTVSVPQYDYRLGYYLNDKTFLSVGEDHMKYTIYKQTTSLTGSIASGQNAGTYHNAEVLVGENSDYATGPSGIIDNLPKGFVSNFEHCDGLNDVSFELGRLEQLWISKNAKDALAVVGTVGIGMVIPDSDVDILGQPPRHDMAAGKIAYHLAGYSCSASIGLQLDFCKHFFLLAKLKGGYINLPDIDTTIYGGKASQHFDFLEAMLVAAYTFSFHKHKN